MTGVRACFCPSMQDPIDPEHYQERLKAHQQMIAARLSSLLPDGLTFEFEFEDGASDLAEPAPDAAWETALSQSLVEASAEIGRAILEGTETEQTWYHQNGLIWSKTEGKYVPREDPGPHRLPSVGQRTGRSDHWVTPYKTASDHG